MPDRSRRYVVLTQRPQRPYLSKVLERVCFTLADEPRSFPPLKLARTDLQNPQHILAAKAVHSSMLRSLHPGGPQVSNSVLRTRFPVLILSVDLGSATKERFRCMVFAWKRTAERRIINIFESVGGVRAMRKSHYSLDYAKNMRG
jgi:hypothetical protein